MKKILTVLLALSVVFTYSFATVGTAFAATSVSDDDAKLIQEATAYAKAQLPTTIEKAYKDVVADEKVPYISEDAWKAMAVGMVEEYEGRYNTEMDKYLKGTTALPSNWDAYPSNLSAVADVLYGTTIKADYTTFYNGFGQDGNPWAVKAAKEQFKINYADIISIYDKIDVDLLYSKTTPEDGDTYYEQAVKAIETSKEALYDLCFDENGEYDAAGYDDAVSKIKTFEDGVIATIEKGSGKTITAVIAKNYDGTTTVQYYYLKGIPTISDEEMDDVMDAATTAAIKAQVAKNIATLLNIDSSVAAKDFVEVYADIYNYLAEKAPKLTGLAQQVANHETTMSALMTGFGDSFANTVKAVADLEAYAEKYAAEKDAAGEFVRDAEEVNKLFEKAKLYEYANAAKLTQGVTVYTIAQAEEDIAAMTSKGDAAKFAFDKEAEKVALDNELAAALDDYYDLEAAQVEAAYAEAKAKVDTAESTKDFTDIRADLKKAVDKIRTAAEVKNLFTTGKMAQELTAQAKSLEEYVGYKNANLQPYEDNYIKPVDNAKLKNLLRDYYIENDARTVEEMKALTGVVEAVAATLPSNKALADAKKAAEDAIAALPSAAKTTSADKDAFVNAYNLAEAYNDMYETATGTAGTLAIPANKISALQADMQNDFNLAYAKADKNDKAALKAIAADVAAADEELYGTLFDERFVDPTVNALAKIRKAEADNVKKLINALPINVTLEDKAQIEAAREAYDAYVEEYMDYSDKVNGYVPNEFKGVYRELALAEAALSILEKDAAIKSVESLKVVKNHSTAGKTNGKSWIKIMWSTQGDDSYVQGYEIYKSTKKNSGYKYAFTTKNPENKWYKNTAGLKKGTMYYYKVRAFVEVDGQKYYSDWSNKAYRKAK